MIEVLEFFRIDVYLLDVFIASRWGTSDEIRSFNIATNFDPFWHSQLFDRFLCSVSKGFSIDFLSHKFSFSPILLWFISLLPSNIISKIPSVFFVLKKLMKTKPSSIIFMTNITRKWVGGYSNTPHFTPLNQILIFSGFFYTLVFTSPSLC
jgi:hypothetical protein